MRINSEIELIKLTSWHFSFGKALNEMLLSWSS